MVHCLVHLEKGMWLGLLPKQQKKKGSQLLGADIRLLQQKTTSDDGLWDNEASGESIACSEALQLTIDGRYMCEIAREVEGLDFGLVPWVEREKVVQELGKSDR